MDGWKPWFVLLLPLCVHVYNQETVVKTIRTQPDITSVCTSEDSGMIVFVTCPVRTQTHRGGECRLQYKCDKQFEHDCDSRFTLISKNGTVFIHLTGLTPVDSGNYTCVCSYERGAHFTHLHITVEAGEGDSIFSGRKFISTAVISLSVATMFIITAGIICGHTARRNHHREKTRSRASELIRSGTPWFLDHDEPYASLQQPASEIYQTMSSSCPHHDAEADPAHIYAVVNQETDGKEKDFHPIYTIYETI